MRCSNAGVLQCHKFRKSITLYSPYKIKESVIRIWYCIVSGGLTHFSSAIGRSFRVPHTLCVWANVWASVTRENLASTQRLSARLFSLRSVKINASPAKLCPFIEISKYRTLRPLTMGCCLLEGNHITSSSAHVNLFNTKIGQRK